MPQKLFTIKGIVREGKKRGKRLGFPTINFPIDANIPEGIYVSQSLIDNRKYRSLTFIGAARTYDEKVFQAETYIFNFGRDIYGQTVTINLLKNIRDNQKFDSEKELIEQMEEDKQMAEEFFTN